MVENKLKKCLPLVTVALILCLLAQVPLSVLGTDAQEPVTRNRVKYADVITGKGNSGSILGDEITANGAKYDITLNGEIVGSLVFNKNDQYLTIILTSTVVVDITWSCASKYAACTLDGVGVYKIPQLLQDNGRTQSFNAIWITNVQQGTPGSYQNISVQQAKQIIDNTPNTVVLDVRNCSEAKFDRLYNALNIPVYLLETVIDFYLAQPDATIIDYGSVTLMEHINDPIIVYCAKGSRSATAVSILAEKGFTNIYNVVGGIDSWIQADLPFYSAAHHILYNQQEITIVPFTNMSCACENQADDDEGLVTNQVVNVMEETENFVQATLSFTYDGTEYNNIVSTTRVWTYEHSDRYSTNVTASLDFTESSGDYNNQEYLLTYRIQHIDYEFLVMTLLQPLDANTYSGSATIAKLIPTGKEELLSVEGISFTSPVTLSELFAKLEIICKDLSQTYGNNGSEYDDANLKTLAVNYGLMADGFKDLSNLIHNELPSYDLEILESVAILIDDAVCTLCVALVDILIGLATCGPLDAILLGLVCTASAVATLGISIAVCGIIVGVVFGVICGTGVTLIASLPLCTKLNYCGINYVGSCYAEKINNGYIYDLNNVKGSPDGYGTALVGYSPGDGANLVCHLNQMSSGGLKATVRTYTTTYVYIYVSQNNNNDWRLLSAGYQYTSSGWYTINAYSSDPYSFVSVTAYSPSYTSSIVVDAIGANYS
ncbi:MAG: rhodanese-like domain-containing protein [Nitrososphaerota archaeon]|jgi:rhodanese-related sulfurtransferase|nr:rhodanese-like domain-containing protein [Nitrososphaerota archaeon]